MRDDRQRFRKFIYRTAVSWVKEKKGVLSSPGKPAIETATPPEFKGHEGIWTPEELFVAAVNACIMTTFLHYAQRDNLEFFSYDSEAEGILERIDTTFMFSEIKVKPKIIIFSDNQIEKAEKLISLSEKACLISNSIKSKVEVIPEIEIRQ